MVFTPDSRRLVVGEADGSIDLYDLATGAHNRRLGKGPQRPHLAVSPRGDRLAVAGHHSCVVQVRDLENGAVLREWIHPTKGLEELYDVAWHPSDPDLLATAGWGIFLWDVSTGKRRGELEGQAGRPPTSPSATAATSWPARAGGVTPPCACGIRGPGGNWSGFPARCPTPARSSSVRTTGGWRSPATAG